MKGKLLTLLAFLVISFSTVAQKKETGVKGGINITNIPLELTHNKPVQAGYHVGIYHCRYLGEHFGWQTELLITQQSTAVKVKDPSGTEQLMLNYLQVPFLLKGKFGHFNIHAGPYGSLLAKVKSKKRPSPKEEGNDQSTIPAADFLKTLETGLAGGIGFDFLRGTCGMRYCYGLEKIMNGKSVDNKAINSALQFYLGFEF